jgi:hypothetical protein
MFLLREWFFYLNALTGIVDERLYRDSKDWHDFKLISRQAVREIRLRLEEQARHGPAGFATPFDWTTISPPESDKGQAPMTTAQKNTRLIGALHNFTVKTFRKLNKGPVG